MDAFLSNPLVQILLAVAIALWTFFGGSKWLDAKKKAILDRQQAVTDGVVTIQTHAMSCLAALADGAVTAVYNDFFKKVKDDYKTSTENGVDASDDDDAEYEANQKKAIQMAFNKIVVGAKDLLNIDISKIVGSDRILAEIEIAVERMKQMCGYYSNKKA